MAPARPRCSRSVLGVFVLLVPSRAAMDAHISAPSREQAAAAAPQAIPVRTMPDMQATLQQLTDEEQTHALRRELQPSPGPGGGGPQFPGFGSSSGGGYYGGYYYGSFSSSSSSYDTVTISPSPPIPPIPSPPPWPPAVPGAGYAPTVTFTYTYSTVDYSTNTMIRSLGDLDAFSPGGRANFTKALEVTFQKHYFPNATTVRVELTESSRRQLQSGASSSGNDPIVLLVTLTFPTLAEAQDAVVIITQHGQHAELDASKALLAPSPPPPPQAPFTLRLCENTCVSRDRYRATFNGECNEAPNVIDSWSEDPESCAMGTDCDDCGAREVCTEQSGCPLKCRERTYKDATAQFTSSSGRRGRSKGSKPQIQPFCAENQLGDGICDPLCNVWECNHDMGDCATVCRLVVPQPCI